MSKSIQRERKVKLKHVLAKLREVIGCSQKSAPDDLGIPTDTCASIESGRVRNVTPSVASRISSWTGISAEWLLNGKSDAPMTAADGGKFTKKTFSRYEAERKKDSLDCSSPVNVDIYRLTCLKLFRSLTIKLAGLMLAAHTSRKVGFIDAKLDKEMRRLAELIGHNRNAYKGFESRLWEEIEAVSAESEAGMIAVFNQLKNGLPPAHNLDEILKQTPRR